MNEPIKLQDSRIFLVIDILCAVFFALCLLFSTISGLRKQDMDTLLICIPIFGGLTLLCALLFPYFFRRKLLLYEKYVSYTPAYGKTRCFSYSEIGYILPQMEKYSIYSYDGRKLAVFENNMPTFPVAYNYLVEKQVRFAPSKPFPSASPSLLQKKSKEWNERFHFTNLDDYVSSHYSIRTIKRQKKITRILSIVLVILCILVFPLSNRWKLLTYTLILLFNYLLSLALYPKLSLESSKKCDDYHITIPFWSSALCIVLLVAFLESVNLASDWWFCMSAALTVILLLPYLSMLALRKIKERPLKLLGIATLLFILSLLITPPINYVTAGTPTHETVIVLEKDYSRSSKTTRHFIMTIWRGELQKMDISKSLYDSIEDGDLVIVCIRKSIFGIELWQIHR